MRNASLACGEAVTITDLNGTTPADGVDPSDGDVRRTPVSVYLIQQDAVCAGRTVLGSEMLFTFADIAGLVNACVGSWLAKSSDLGPVLDVYFATLYGAGMFQGHRFLSLVQAVEAYHRRSCESHELPREQHEERVRAIVDAAPERHRAWLARRLEYSNEKT